MEDHVSNGEYMHNDDAKTKVRMAELERRRNELSQQLERVRQQRRELAQVRRRQRDIETKLEAEKCVQDYRLQEILSCWQSAALQQCENEDWLSYARQWNVLSDCFTIDTKGPFVTINGLRLGVEATVSTLVYIEEQPKTPTEEVGPVRRYFFGMSNGNNNTTSNGNKGEATQQTSTSEHKAKTIKVAWPEINAALGQVALLLHIVMQSPHVSDTTFYYQLQPCGSTSRIGVRSTLTSPFTYYSLFADDGLYLFGRRPLQYALPALVHCVAQLSQALQKRDKTMVLPHVIATNTNSGGEVTIGDLPIAYDSANLAQWTRAMKYLLTNINHLLIFQGWTVGQDVKLLPTKASK